MPAGLVLASALTLALLFGSVLFVVFLVLLLVDAPPVLLVLVALLSIGWTVASWAFGPWIYDALQGWLFKIEKVDFDTFARHHPAVARAMRETCEREGLPLPAIRLIDDANPTAYTYGSLPSNARVAFSKGLLELLDEDEAAAVADHELGHIRHYDFAVMTIAAILLQVLYYGYVLLRRSDGEDRKATVAAAFLVYALWWVGTYVVLFLSRTREYMADRFAAVRQGDAAPLQRALVRIAYGLADLEAAANARGVQRDVRLLDSTRALGIADPNAAVGVGQSLRLGEAQQGLSSGRWRSGEPAITPEPGAGRSWARVSFLPEVVEPVMRFDLFNPWASVVELESTHPLTAKRLRALDDVQPELNRSRTFRWDAIDGHGDALDQGRLRGDFAFEVALWFLPTVLPILGLLLGIFRPELALGLAVSALGLGLLVRGLYVYAFLDPFEPATVYDLMCDPYASPLRGRAVRLEGRVIGKVDAGARFGEDMMFEDRSGGRIALNYESWLPLLGNLLLGSRVADAAIGQPVVVTGWFRRGVAAHIDLAEVRIGGATGVVHPSYTRFWGLWGGAAVLVVGLALLGAGLLIGAPSFGDDAPRAVDERGVEKW